MSTLWLGFNSIMLCQLCTFKGNVLTSFFKYFYVKRTIRLTYRGLDGISALDPHWLDNEWAMELSRIQTDLGPGYLSATSGSDAVPPPHCYFTPFYLNCHVFTWETLSAFVLERFLCFNSLVPKSSLLSVSNVGMDSIRYVEDRRFSVIFPRLP